MVEVRMLDVTNEDVMLAADVFQWEHGVPLRMHSPEESGPALENADVYAAVAFRSAHHLRLKQAIDAELPTLLALQFPEPMWLSPSVLCRRNGAFDPHVFAADLGGLVKPWL
jgi:hypothetical protein